jgi:hypothetical protein
MDTDFGPTFPNTPRGATGYTAGVRFSWKASSARLLLTLWAEWVLEFPVGPAKTSVTVAPGSAFSTQEAL